MPKLSVVVPSNEVEVEGVKYRKVERKAQAGDIVKITDDGAPSSVTNGAFYEVDFVDSDGDPRILDEDGDDYYLYHEDFEVYEKVTEPAAQEYREVKREAAVGERIKIVKAGYAGNPPTYINGESFTVTSLHGSMGVRIDRKWLDSDDTDAWVAHDEYVVLEPANVAKPAEPAPQKRLTISDYAKVIANNADHNYEIGSVVKIITDDHDGTPYEAERADGSTGNWLQEDDVVPATEAEFNAQKPLSERLKVGEYAKVVQPGHGNHDKIVKVTKNDRDGSFIYETEKLSGISADIHRMNQLVPATESEVEAAKKAIKIGEFADGGYAEIVNANKSSSLSGFENGDYVKVSINVGYHALKVTTSSGLNGYCNADALRKVTREEYEAATEPRLKVGELARTLVGKDVPKGAIIRITRDDRSGRPYRGELLDGSEYDWYASDQLEKVSEEEAKWAAIGRKVGEYKRGDVVEVVASTGFVPVGTIGEVSEFSDVAGFRVEAAGHTAGNWHFPRHVKLIVPVEQRFDRAKGGASTSK